MNLMEYEKESRQKGHEDNLKSKGASVKSV